MSTQPKPTIDDIIKFYETHDWLRGAYWNKDKTAFCLSGAVAAVSGVAAVTDRFITDEQMEYYQNFIDLTNEVRKKINHPVISSWNDYPGRTKEEVIAALRS